MSINQILEELRELFHQEPARSTVEDLLHLLHKNWLRSPEDTAHILTPYACQHMEAWYDQGDLDPHLFLVSHELRQSLVQHANDLPPWAELLRKLAFSRRTRPAHEPRTTLEALISSPLLRNLQGLRLEDCTLNAESMRTLRRSIHMDRLRKLELPFNPLEDKGTLHLTHAPHLSNLTHLDLRNTEISDTGLARIVRSPYLKNLRELRLDNNHIHGDALYALGNANLAKNLQTLTLSENPVQNAALLHLANSTELIRLRTLNLDGVEVMQNGARAIAEAIFAPHLEYLSLNSAAMDQRAIFQLSIPREFKRLTSLHLNDNDIQDVGARHLADSSLYKLEILFLAQNNLTDDGARALAASPVFSRLEYLDLQDNKLTEDGVRALLESPHMRRLEGLSLDGNPLSASSLERLQAEYFDRITLV